MLKALQPRDEIDCMCQEKKEDDSPALGILLMRQHKNSKIALKRTKKY